MAVPKGIVTHVYTVLVRIAVCVQRPLQYVTEMCSGNHSV